MARKRGRGRISPTGPYLAESSNKHLRSRASAAERRILSYGSTPTAKRVRHFAAVDHVASSPSAATPTRPHSSSRGAGGRVALAQLMHPQRASAQGQAMAHREGAVRAALEQDLRRARGRVARTSGITGPLQPDQKIFVRQVAKRTGLSPRAIGAQALAEESGPYAAQRQVEGNENWLNIGPGAQLAPSPKGAAKETAHLINTGPSYSGIRASRGKGPQAQIAAIAQSPWGTSGATMVGTLPLIHRRINPAARASLRRVEAKARNLGVSLRPAAPKQPTRLKVAVRAALELSRAKLPYVWGGGHGAPHSEPTGGGLDCSGAVSYVLNKMGALEGSLTSGQMGSVLKPGPGAVTVFYNSEHTFMHIAGYGYFGTSNANPGGGAGKIPVSVARAEIASGNTAGAYNVGHVASVGGRTGGFPGMTLTTSGNIATITGRSVTQSAPGFSRQPIHFTPIQRRNQTMRKLRLLGVPVPGESRRATETKPDTLTSLERRYGVS